MVMLRPSWTTCSLQELPFLPFRPQDQLERSVLEYISARLLGLARHKRREYGSSLTLKSFSFYESNCIAGIDISSIQTAQISYLDKLWMLSTIHPFVLLNCDIDEGELKKLYLHSNFAAKGYILPVFRPFPADDISEKQKYYPKIHELLCGKINEISLPELLSASSEYRIEDILQRYRGLYLKNNDKLCYHPESFWLGVKSEEISRGLSYLFVNSIEEFSLPDFISEYNIVPAEFNKYIESSMLLEKISEDTVRFRLQRKTFIPAIMNALVDKFESKMVQCNVIDTTHVEYVHLQEKIDEYHCVGKIFEPRDAYALNLLSYIRQEIYYNKNKEYGKTDFNCIAVIDNGHTQDLIDLLPKVFERIKIIRVFNYYGSPLISPFDSVEPEDKVIILWYVANTGNFLRNTINAFQSKFNINIYGVYSFLLNTTFNRKSFFDEGLIEKGGFFAYFLSKKLADLSHVRLKSQKERFETASPESYLVFWSSADEYCNFVNNHSSYHIELNPNQTNTPVAWLTHYTDIHFRNNEATDFNKTSGFYLFLDNYLKEISADFFLLGDNDKSQGIINIIKSISPNLRIKSAIDIIKECQEQNLLLSNKKIIIFFSTINVGDKILDLLKNFNGYQFANLEVHILYFVSFRNPIESTFHITEKHMEAIIKTAKSFKGFYSSFMPYYLFNNDDIDKEYLKSKSI